MVTVSNIANASQGELLCITYEMLLEEIQNAMEEQTKDERKKHIDQAVKIIKMLASDLDFRYDLAHQLFNIYVYVQGLLIKSRDHVMLEEAYKLINKLYEAYKQITENEQNKKPIMQNAEAIYAGLTYGKDSINEVSLEDFNRGYKA